jgi:hypothetical protein
VLIGGRLPAMTRRVEGRFVGLLTVASALPTIFGENAALSSYCLREDLMLPPFIIEQIRKREEEERARYEQPQLDLPIERPRPRPAEPAEEEANRGVVILDLGGD